jgi:hypothetical protein
MRNKRWLTGLASALLLTMVVGSPALGNDQDRCTLATLDGLYVFAATGFSIPTPTTSAPKAIIELIRFNGDGTLTVPAVTVSLNGNIPQVPAGGTGIYTVADVIPGDEACSGTLVFASGTSFNLAFAHHAKTIYMIQTNQGNVFQGTATRLSH